MGKDPEGPATANAATGPTAHLPAVMARNENTVRRRFWRKMAAAAAKIPFAEDAIAAYYACIDKKTPRYVRATLLGALAYFVIPTDAIPDFIAGLGFTDDATVLSGALAIVSQHIKPHHRHRAQAALQRLRQGSPVEPD